MKNAYDFLEGVLAAVENGLKEDINIDALAEENNISTRHLLRLFKFAFNQTLGAYIRSRKLSESTTDLLNENLNILNIALDYSFEYEQSYIRSFRREFGITPGDFRKKGQIVKITPPIQLFDRQKLKEGIIFGPDIVRFPKTCLAGKKHKLPFHNIFPLTGKYFDQFINHERKDIKDAINSNIIYCISRTAGNNNADYCTFMPSVQVKAKEHVPEGYDYDTFESSTCARFRLIFKTKEDLNMYNSVNMFNIIENFMENNNHNYFLERKRVNIDRFELSAQAGFYQWEWFSPVIGKTAENSASLYPDGIIKTYKQKLPSLRFMGKKFIYETMEECNKKSSKDYLNLKINGAFDDLEKHSNNEIRTLYEENNAYISLTKKNEKQQIENLIGLFLPEGTKVPKGFVPMDFPKAQIGVCRVYGKEKVIINYENECRKKLLDEGFVLKEKGANEQMFFRRFNWHRFFEEDKDCKRMLDYCFFVK